MGTPPDEPGRGKDEGPQRRVTIPTAIAVGRYEVTRGEYETFLRATGHPVSGNCVTDRRHQGDWQPDAGTNLRDPGFTQTDKHPVVCVSWADAQAYIAWLNAQSSGGYRLPTEAEWEYVARAGSTTAYPWGSDASAGCADANIFDAAAVTKYTTAAAAAAACNDGAINTMPVGSYRPNAFGLYDMIGNVEEWVQDCVTDSYSALEADGTSSGGDCTRHIVRSGSWGAVPNDARSGNRIRYATLFVDDSIGFRIVKTMTRS